MKARLGCGVPTNGLRRGGIGLLSMFILFVSEKTRSGGALGDRALPSVGADHRAARTGNGALGDRALGVTTEEIAHGWGLESATTNEAVSYAMPTNGVEYMPWSLGGGYEARGRRLIVIGAR